MNVLVTGGSGFIGSHVVDKLIESGHRVRIMDIKNPSRRQDIEFLKGNITSKEDLRRSLSNIDIVYHIAAFSNIDLVKANPLTTMCLHGTLTIEGLISNNIEQGAFLVIFLAIEPT